MKSIIRILMCVLFIAFIAQLAGCGNRLSNNVSWNAKKPENTYEYENIDYFPKKPTIEETIMYDQNQVRISATGISYSSSHADILLLIENNTNHDITVDTTDYNSINRYMYALWCSEDITAGDSSEVEITVYGDDLLYYGITDIAEFELDFIIRDQNENEIETGPCRVLTSLSDKYDYSDVSVIKRLSSPKAQKYSGHSVISISDADIYDCLGISAIQEGIFKTKDDELKMILEFKNNGEDIKSLSMRSLAINGITIDDGYCDGQSFTPGSMGELSINLSRILDHPEYKLVGLDSISTVSFDLSLYDTKYRELADPARITLNLSDDDSLSLGTPVYEGTYFNVYQIAIFPDESEYSDNYHIILVYESLTEEEIEIDLSYKGLSINGSTDAVEVARSVDLSAKELEFADIEVFDYSYDDIGISTWGDVSSVSIKLEANLSDSRDIIEEATIDLDPEETELP